VKPGDSLTAVIEKRWYSLLVLSVSSEEIRCRIEDARDVRSSDLPGITVYQGLLKGSKMDSIVSRLAELGVQRFVPMLTERSVPVMSSSNRIERWRRLAAQGAKVTGCEDCMTVSDPLTYHETLKNLNKELNRVIILFCVEQYQFHLLSYVRSLHTSDDADSDRNHFHLFFGPEGGFSLQEIEYASQCGAASVSMGSFVLKSDTAAIVGTGFIRLYFAY
jgi:16S rRNA (uracil1498-N3)-methyltransferase